MPMAKVQVTREGTRPGTDHVTPEEKAAVIKGISQVLLDVLNKPLDKTWVIIEEVEVDNWGQGGLPLLRISQAAGRKAGLTRRTLV